MVVITKFDIGDIVSTGPISNATVIGVKFYSGITYDINYWDDNKATVYSAYEWELELVRKNDLIKDN
jgi:hypothetical protein